MKIALIDPKGVIKGINNGLVYIASNLIKNRHNAKIIDLNNADISGSDVGSISFAETVRESDYVGISMTTSTYREGLKIIKIIKEINTKAKIVCGGPHPTIDGINLMKEAPDIDFCLVGEGDGSFVELLDKGKPGGIKGVIYREGDEIKENQGFNIIEDLDSLPLPDYSLVKAKPNPYPLITSRGCPYSCTYCSVGRVSGRKWRVRKPELVVEELKIAKKRYGITSFNIIDDNFTLDIERAKKICRLIMQEGLNLRWACPNGIRADRIDEELVSLMKKSGCFSINIGIESGVDKVFNTIEKGERLDDVVRAARMIKRYRIITNGGFIIGLKDSTYDLDMKSLEFSRKLKMDMAIWNLFVPYPQTKMYDDLMGDKEVRFLRDWKDGFHFGDDIQVVFETSKYSAKEKKKMYFIANLRSRNYGMLATEGSFAERFLRLLKIILRYDSLYLPVHIIRAFFLFYRFKINCN